MFEIIIILFFTALAGFVAGLFGVGGGIILVPLFYFIFSYSNKVIIPEYLLGKEINISIASSLLLIFFTSIISLYSHSKSKKVDFAYLKRNAIFIFLGGVFGSFVIYIINPFLLQLFFAIFILLVTIYKFIFTKNNLTIVFLKNNFIGRVINFLIGLISAMAGIGGGILAVIYFSFIGKKIHNSIATASAYGLFISLSVIVISFFITFFNEDIYMFNDFWFGYIYLPLVLLSLISLLVTVPLGAKIAHSLDEKKIKLLLSIYMIFISIYMMYDLFT